MKKTIFILIGLCLITYGLFAEGTPEPDLSPARQSSELQNALKTRGVVILPEKYLRGYDPITVFYSSIIGPDRGGPLDNPGDLLSITPPVPGEYRFLDARTIQFLPAISWPALKSFTIKTRSETRVLITLMTPPTAISPPPGAKNLEPIKAISLKFSSEIPPADLAQMLSFEVKTLPGLLNSERVWLKQSDFTIKMLDKTDNTPERRYEVVFKNLIGYEKQLTLHLRLSLDESIAGSVAEYSFYTKQAFRLYAAGCGSTRLPLAFTGSVFNLEQALDCGAGKTPLFLEFTEELAPLSIETIKKLIQFEPAVNDLRFELAGTKIYLYFNAERETPYRLKLNYQPLVSLSGRTLSLFGETSFYFYYRRLSSYIQWQRGQAMVERFGPKLFPMRGLGVTEVDLRIYKIDPLSRNFWPFPTEPVAVDEDARPPMPGEEPPYGKDLVSQIKLLGTPHISQIVKLPLSPNSGEVTFGLNLEEYLTRIAGANAAGTYLVGYRPLGSGSRRIYVRLTVTDLSLSTVEEEHAVIFMVTSLASGKPLAGATIIVEGEDPNDKKWVEVIKGVTDSRGLYRYEHSKRIEASIRRVIVSYGSDKLIIDPNNPPPLFVNNHWWSANSRWLAWLNSEPKAERERALRRGYIYTERPVYRPEDEVHIMGFVRQRQKGLLLADEPGRERKLVITGPGYRQWSYPVVLQVNGSFYHKFNEKDLPTGNYTASLIDVKDNQVLATTQFKKEAYRIPTFEVNLMAPDRVPLDRSFEVLLTAEYYAGGRVTGQEVRWQITKLPYPIQPANLPGFIFATDESVSGVRYATLEGSTTQKGKTDENGSAKLIINPALENEGLPRIYVIEATVSGADTQTVTAVKKVIAVPAFTLGIKVERFVKDSKAIKPEIIIIDHNERPLAGKQFTLRLLRREWHAYLSQTDFTTGQVKYHTDVVDKMIFERNYESLDRPLALSLPVEEAGVYVIELLARDNLGRLQRLQVDLFVAGDTPLSWQKAYANVFETSLDKKAYNPGETATLLLKSPFQNALALVVLELPNKNEYSLLEIRNGQGLYSFKVTPDMVPRVAVHALLLRGRIATSSEPNLVREDRGKPIAMANTTWVNVNTTQHQLEVKLEHSAVSQPGRKLTIRIRVTDYAGKPVSGYACLWLVDRAVLALGQERVLNPLASFIDPVYSALRISDTRNEVIGNIPLEEKVGGDGRFKSEMEESMRLFTADELLQRTTVRRNFQTVPYLNPLIPVTNGLAEVTVDLPDNLTDFAIRAVVTSDMDKFGVGSSAVALRLPVIVQPSLPRFVRPGDEFIAGGIGRIVEGQGGPGSVAIQVEGLRLKGKENQTKDSQSIIWQEKEAQKLYFTLAVPPNLTSADDKNVAVKMAVERKADGATDGFEVKLPIKSDTKVVLEESLSKAETTGTKPLLRPTMPARSGTMRQTVVLTYEPAIIKILAGLRYLSSYQHGCTEQRISRLYPAIALKKALTTLGLADFYKLADEVWQEDLAFLEAALTPEGLYAYWPGGTGFVSLTAYVVEFLTQAKAAGFQFPEKLLLRPLQALKEALRSDYNYFISGFAFQERVEALVALSEAGMFDSQYAFDLLVGAFNSDLYTQAKILGVFLANKRGGEPKVKELAELIRSKTIFKLKDNKEVFAGLQIDVPRWGALFLSSEIKTLAEVLRVLYLENPQNPRLALMLDYLLERADDSGWGNTNDNVAALKALATILLGRQLKSSSHTFEFTSGKTKVNLATNNKNVVIYSLRSDEPASLKYLSGDKNLLPYIWNYLEYIPAITADGLAAENRGFVVEREILVYNEGNQLISRQGVKANEAQSYLKETVVEEHIRVINPENRNFVAVVVPLAAGFEPLNPELAIAAPEAKPLGQLTLKPNYTIYSDDAVIFYYNTLPKGSYDFYFRLRASFEGTYILPPAYAELLYDLRVFGRSTGTKVLISQKK